MINFVCVNLNKFYSPMNRFILILILLNLLLLSGCGSSETPKYKIGVSQCSSDVWRDKMNNEMYREMLFHDNAIIEIRSADDSNRKQIEDIEYFLKNKFDIIIVAPNEADSITDVVKKVYNSGIPVIIFDRKVRGDSYTVYYDLDNKKIGKLAAEYIPSILGKKEGKVIEITGLPGSTPAEERHTGFLEGLAENPQLHLLACEPGNWIKEDATIVADSLLKVHPDVNVIYTHSDFMAFGVAEVLEKNHRDDIKLLGTDAAPEQGIPAIIDGIIDASFIYPTDGHKIIRTAFDILEGKPVEKIIYTPALATVDKSNAEIMKRQYDLLNDETQKVLLLNEKNDKLWLKYKEQSAFLYTVIGFSLALILILVILAVILRKNILLQKELREKNQTLIEERDRQIGLYSKLDTVLQAGKNTESEFYNKFMSIIRNQYTNTDLNTETISGRLNLGPAQLTRKVKALTNYTPVEILRNFRMEQARNLLLTTDMNISEITIAVGFSSPAYLTKCFREHFGRTPTELRSSK